MPEQALETKVDVVNALRKSGVTAGTLVEVVAFSSSEVQSLGDGARHVRIIDPTYSSGGQRHAGYVHPDTYERMDCLVLTSSIDPRPTKTFVGPRQMVYPIPSDRLEIPYGAVHHVDAFKTQEQISLEPQRVFVHPKATWD